MLHPDQIQEISVKLTDRLVDHCCLSEDQATFLFPPIHAAVRSFIRLIESETDLGLAEWCDLHGDTPPHDDQG